jgi:hypothetical protein
MTDFNSVKDSGERQEFETGARRDTQEGKPRFGLIPPYPLRRLAMHYTNAFALMWYIERMPEMNDLATYLAWPVAGHE